MDRIIQKKRINKHPEFDDPFIEDEINKNISGMQFDRSSLEDGLNKDMNIFLRGKAEVSFLTNSESKLAQYSVKLSQETSMSIINMVVNIVHTSIYNQNPNQDPTYSIPLMDYFFGNDKQVLINCVFCYLIKIYPSDDFNQESIELMNLLINIMKNAINPNTKSYFLIKYKHLILQELRHHFLQVQKLLCDELKPQKLDSKRLILLELFQTNIVLDKSLAKYITNKCWDKLLEHFFCLNSKKVCQPIIKLAYIYKIIVASFSLQSEKLLLNLICSQNLLAPLAAIFEAKESWEIYDIEPKIFLCSELLTYSHCIARALTEIERSKDQRYNQLKLQLKVSSNWKKIKTARDVLECDLHLDRFEDLALNPEQFIENYTPISKVEPKQDLPEEEKEEVDEDEQLIIKKLKEIKKYKTISSTANQNVFKSQRQEINKVPIEPKNNDFSFSSSGILYSIDEGDRYVSSKFKKCESESVSDF